MATAGRVAQLRALYKRGWVEIPEVMASTGLAIFACILAAGGYIYQRQRGGFRLRHTMVPVVLRPDDPRLKQIKYYSDTI